MMHDKNPKSLVTGELAAQPWQHATYSADCNLAGSCSASKYMHIRQTNVSLGTATVDFHDQALQYTKIPATIQLASKLRQLRLVTRTVRQCPPSSEAALHVAKYEAARAITHLLAQIHNDHGSFPTDSAFRLRSDLGSVFNGEFDQSCRRQGIHRTTTAGHDPNANASAESAVGTLKRRCRYLLSGCRLPTDFWGIGIFAAAQLCRADAGLGELPRIPFGTRAMLVVDPKPRNAFMPRVQQATVFGPSS